MGRILETTLKRARLEVHMHQPIRHIIALHPAGTAAEAEETVSQVPWHTMHDRAATPCLSVFCCW